MRGDLDAAEAAAEEAAPLPELAVLADVVAALEARLVLALVADRRRRPHEASQRMRSALEVARGQRLVQPFLANDSDRVALVLQRVVDDGLPYSEKSVSHLLARLTRDKSSAPEPKPLIDPLTARELAVLAELRTMKTNAEIAAEFFVSTNTVKTQLQRLLRKLEVPNRREAVRRGRELGLIS